MKKLLLSTTFVAALLLTTPAYAFGNNNQLEVSASVSSLTFGVTASQNSGFESFYLDYDAFSYPIGVGQSTVTLGAEFMFGTQQTAISVTHGTEINYGSFGLNVAPEVVYLSDVSTLENGQFFFMPTVGMSYELVSGASVVGSVQYGWNASNSWSRSGGEARIGFDFAMNENLTLSPYVSHTFDVVGQNNDTQVGLAVGVSF
jgi:hypothetical protein